MTEYENIAIANQEKMRQIQQEKFNRPRHTIKPNFSSIVSFSGLDIFSSEEGSVTRSSIRNTTRETSVMEQNQK